MTDHKTSKDIEENVTADDRRKLEKRIAGSHAGVGGTKTLKADRLAAARRGIDERLEQLWPRRGQGPKVLRRLDTGPKVGSGPPRVALFVRQSGDSAGLVQH
jgi:hypothetical protein